MTGRRLPVTFPLEFRSSPPRRSVSSCCPPTWLKLVLASSLMFTQTTDWTAWAAHPAQEVSRVGVDGMSPASPLTEKLR